MDGLLIVDKPDGPTSHDVVARMRRTLRERRIGHTGTLDPMATGVLPLVVGKATRLAQFLSAGDKSYEAVVRLGFATDTGDAQGQALTAVSGRALPSREEIDEALNAFRGTFMQQPPAFSAKKIDGQPSYKLARHARLKPSHSVGVGLPAEPAPPALPAPCSVTTHRLEIVSTEADTVTLRVDCSAGFYIRSLAHDLGERLGVGAHLAALRRTRVGDFGLDSAIGLDAAERDPQRAVDALVPVSRMLPGVPFVRMTDAGTSRARHGQDIGPGELVEPSSNALSAGPDQDRANRVVRLLDRAGELIAIAQPAMAAGVLHPFVVLV